jgi:hypothetical protein
MAITLGLVEAVDDNGVYVSMPGSRGVLRGPYRSLSSVAVGVTALVTSTDDGEQVVAGVVGNGDSVSVKAFGAKGDGVTDDTFAIRSALDAANALRVVGLGGNIYRPGATVVFPPGRYSLQTLDEPLVASCNLEGPGATLVVPDAYDDVALLVGHEVTGKLLHTADVVLPGVTKDAATSLVSGSVGVRVQNLTHSMVRAGRITHHATGLHVTGLGQGSAYNQIHIGWIDLCKVAVDLRPLAGGWSNQNTFVGGGVTQSPNTLDGGSVDDTRRSGWRHVILDGSTGEGTVNANTFVGVSFEGDLSEYHLSFKYAQNNTFVGCRHEQGSAAVAATVSGDTFTSSGHGLSVGDTVVFFNGGTAALGLDYGSLYWVVAETTNTFEVSSSRGGVALTCATAGSGIEFYRPPVVVFDGDDGLCQGNEIRNFYSYPGQLDVRGVNSPFGNRVDTPTSAGMTHSQADLMPGRNRLINGDFRINQREYASGTSVSGDVYTFDRWKTLTAMSLTFTASPNGQPVTIPSMKGIVQIVERANIEAGTYTLSWKGNALGRVYPSGGTPPTAAYSPITVDLDGTTDVRVEIEASDAVDVTVAEVQLERGTEATPFERVPISVALDACRRYYLRWGQPVDAVVREAVGTAAVFDATTAWLPVNFPVPMRAAPTLSVSGAYLRLIGNSTAAYWDTATAAAVTTQSARVAITSSGLTGGQALFVDTGDYSGLIEFSAEL